MISPDQRLDLFMAKVKMPPGRDACWEWTGALSGRQKCGYFWNGEKVIIAHRFLLEPIPKGKEVCHHCDNPRCVRPSHLFIGTHRDNMRDCANKGRLRLTNAHLAVPRGEGHPHPHHKLTEDQVREIRRLGALKTITHEAIGFIFGVTRSAVGGIVTRTTWRHIP
jgi:hypothetical protein